MLIDELVEQSPLLHLMYNITEHATSDLNVETVGGRAPSVLAGGLQRSL